jgi:hypothetical protein
MLVLTRFEFEFVAEQLLRSSDKNVRVFSSFFWQHALIPYFVAADGSSVVAGPLESKSASAPESKGDSKAADPDSKSGDDSKSADAGGASRQPHSGQAKNQMLMHIISITLKHCLVRGCCCLGALR